RRAAARPGRRAALEAAAVGPAPRPGGPGLGPLPDRVVALHDAIALGELESAGQPAGKDAERLLVARTDQQQVVVASPDRLGARPEAAAVGELHARQVRREAHRTDL